MARVLAKANQDRAGVGIAMMLVAYLVFSFIDTAAKWLVIAGLHAFQLSFMRYFGHFVISVFHIGSGGFERSRYMSDHLGLVVFRSSLLVTATVLNFISLKYLPLTITSAIMFSAPFIVSALSWPLLGERVGPWRWFAISLGFIGVIIVMRPFGESFHWAAFLSVFNAFAMALYSILTRKLSGTVATETMQFYTGALGTFALAPFAISVWQNPSTTVDWIIMASLGVWGWGGHELLTRAHGLAPASVLMPFTYSFLVYLTISSYLVFNELPDQFTIIGVSIIVFSGMIIWARENRKTAL